MVYGNEDGVAEGSGEASRTSEDFLSACINVIDDVHENKNARKHIVIKEIIFIFFCFSDYQSKISFFL